MLLFVGVPEQSTSAAVVLFLILPGALLLPVSFFAYRVQRKVKRPVPDVFSACSLF